MKKITKFNFKTLLVLFLSISLCLSTVLTIACDGKDSSSNSSSSSKSEATVYPTDAQTLLNGDFEFSTFTKKATEFPVSSSISWVRSSDSITSSAVSSSYVSGIIDTDEAIHKEYAKNAGFPVISEEGAEEVVYYNPGTPYDHGFISEDDSFAWSEVENETNEDGKPLRSLTFKDKELKTASKVLMIHNEVKGSDGKGNGEGTAQKFTSSSSLSLAKHEFAKLTVWVKTHNLVSKYYENGEFGAYIAVQNTVSTATTPFIIKNINTESQWAKYTIYLSASDFATSSFKVVLGLGFGSKEIRRDYVEGFAFFDNVNFDIIDKAEYDAGIDGVTEYNLYDDNNEVRDTLNADENGVDFAKNDSDNDVKFTERKFILSHTRENGALTDIDFADGETTFNRGHGATVNTSTLNAINANLAEADKVLGPTDEDYNVLYFNHSEPASSTYVTDKFELEAGKYLKLSFWVKVKTVDKDDVALTVTLNDVGSGNSKEINTVIASNVNTNEFEDNANYNNWIEYIVYVSNTLDDSTPRFFTLTFDFGTTEPVVNNLPWSLTEGYAIITEPTGYFLSEEDYSIANVSSYSYAKKVSLTADYPNGVESEDKNDDSYTFTHGLNDNNTIKSGVATNVVTYKGVVGGSPFVGGSNARNEYDDATVTHGVVNSQYVANYDADIQDALKDLGKLNGNTYVQPLLIKTTEGGKTFGYVGSNSTISAGATTIISVKVKVTGKAVAYIYITNSDALESFNVLGVDAQGKKAENNELVNDGEALNRKFVITVTAEDMTKNAAILDEGWLTVNIQITAGANSIAYRTELWNGARDAETANGGIVLFDGYTASSATNKTKLVDELKIETGEVPSVLPYNHPTKVLYTDNNGNDTFTYKTNKPTDSIIEFVNSKQLIVDFTAIDAEYEVDNTDSKESEDDETLPEDSSSSSNESSFSWALQITSIIIAAVLILLLIVILVKMLLDKYGKKKNSSKDYYNRDSREKAGLAIEAKKARKQKEAEEVVEEEVKPYDYDNMENNVEEESTDEEVEVETVEEATEGDAEATVEETETESDTEGDAE